MVAVKNLDMPSVEPHAKGRSANINDESEVLVRSLISESAAGRPVLVAAQHAATVLHTFCDLWQAASNCNIADEWVGQWLS